MTAHSGLHLSGVAGVDLQVHPGEMVALIGPSGSGKTTLLRRVAGLEPLPAGTVSISGRDMARVPVEHRPATMMFETPVLFPQLTVSGNIAFAVGRGDGGLSAADALDVALTSLDLRTLADRLPHELSAGQRQRVALARALVRQPRVMLFDEPLAHVDPAARGGLLQEISRIHRRMGSASLLVTHDWSDALAVADRIAVMRDGVIVQVDTPREVYSHPASAWIATRVGIPNFLSAPVDGLVEDQDGHRVRVSILGAHWDVPASSELRRVGERCIVLGHPHAFTMVRVADRRDVDPRLGHVLATTFGGDHVDHDVETDAGTLVIRRPLGPRDEPWPPGTAVEVGLLPEAVWAVASG
ncbi:ABC transporter ATP-binding protein [Brachybacterium alimentarium]|uniref:ABC transporter ATP-binding protein n=1 Tax=Brachybacterium alimentarium TaxID=47845 RepID=UPI003FD0F31B